MTTIQTRYGAMRLYSNINELESLDYDDCVRWLAFNDRNGCYSKQDQISEFGECLTLAEMKHLILDQSAE